MTRTPAFPKVKYTNLSHWQLAAITKAVEAMAPALEPVSAEALVKLLRNASEIRVTYREGEMTDEASR